MMQSLPIMNLNQPNQKALGINHFSPFNYRTKLIHMNTYQVLIFNAKIYDSMNYMDGNVG